MQLLDANKFGALGLMIADRLETALGDLSPSAAALLLTLALEPERTTTQLAAIAGISQPTAVRVRDGLIKKGLIARAVQRGRSAPLALTEAGRARARTLETERLAALDRLLSPLAPTERETFIALMDKILAGATTSRANARTTCRLCAHDLCTNGLCPVGNKATKIEAQEAVNHARSR